MPIKVLIVDDHSVVREGLRNFLALDPGIEVVGSAPGGKEAVELTIKLQPDVVLMDLLMPDTDGFTATTLIKRERPQTEVVILTSALEEASVARAVRAGASGYLLKNMEAEELCKAIRAVVAGQVIFAPQAAMLLAQSKALTSMPTATLNAPGISLTDREKDVLKLLAQGKTNKEIAYNLQLSDKTIKLHVSVILAKLGMQSRTQAALYAVQLGLLPNVYQS